MSLHRDYRMVDAVVGDHSIVADNKGYDINDQRTHTRIHQQMDKAWSDPFTNFQRAKIWLADHIHKAKKAEGVTP